MGLKRLRSPPKKRRETVAVVDEEVVSSGDEDRDQEDVAEEKEPVRGRKNGNGFREEEEEEEEEDAAETAAEKRLRMAKQYLADLGVGEEGEEDDGGDEDDFADEERLASVARRDAGLASVELADSLREADVGVTSDRRGHRLSPTCISMVPDGSLAVSGGKDRRVTLWDVETNKTVHSFLGGDVHGSAARTGGHVKEVLGVAIEEDGRTVVSAGRDQVIRVWDVRARAPVGALGGHRAAVTSVALRHNSRQLYTTSNDRTLKVYDIREMAYVETLFGHGAEVISVDALSRERVLSGGMDGSVRLWKITEGSQLLFKSSAQSIDAVSMLNDSLFFTGGSDGTLYLWGAHKKKPLSTYTPSDGLKFSITSVAACAFSDLCASGSQDGQLRLWKASPAGKAAPRSEAGLQLLRSVPMAGFINGMCFGKSGRVLAVATGQEHRLGRWSRCGSWKSNAVCFLTFSDN